MLNNKSPLLKIRDPIRNNTPDTQKRTDRRGSFKSKKKLINVGADNAAKKLFENNNDNEEDNKNEINKRPLSQENRAQKKFSHSVYNKAALMFDHLVEAKGHVSTETLEFESEFEKRRVYSLAFAAKRYEAILKDVLLDSSFYSSYFQLETFHHSKVLVMLLDFYEHKFRFSESTRKDIEVDNATYLNHINEIQSAFFKHKIKLCSAFARNRIKACALTLDAMLPVEVKERGECGARHPLCCWINPVHTNLHEALHSLKEGKFVKRSTMKSEEHTDRIFCLDELFEDFLIFSPYNKDDVYNCELVASSSIIPMSKPRYLMAEIIRRVINDIKTDRKKSSELIQGLREGEEREGFDIILTHAETGSLAAHICSFINQNNRLYVFGCHGKKKVEVEKNLRKMGVNYFELIPERFSDIQVSEDRFASVKVIICNPPCSKSGVANPVDFILQEGSETALSLSKVITKSEIRGFAEEQASTLRHAFNFGLVQSVVYLTFSCHSEENENLVQRILAEQQERKSSFEFMSTLQDIMEQLKLCEYQANKYISVPPTNLMDGFFTALLSRKIREDSVRDIMERAAKKGLVKTSKSNKKTNKATVNIKTGSHPQQPPFVAQRISKKPKTKSTTGVSAGNQGGQSQIECDENEEKERRFKF